MCLPLDAVAAITEPLGAAVMKGQPIGWIAGRKGTIDTIPERRIANPIDVSNTRELARYVEYGLVDIAIIALSPAVNDPNTAVEVIEEMSMLFRDIPPATLGPYRVTDGEDAHNDADELMRSEATSRHDLSRQ